MPIAPLLQQFVDDELARAPALIERCVAGTLTLLRETKDGLHSSERAHHFAIVELLQRQSAAYQRAFVDSLRNRVVEELGQQAGAADAAAPGASSGLELMDESRVEVDIEISRAMQLIDTTAEWELRELQTFTSTLMGQSHVSAESNPLRPLHYASALWDAAAAIVPTHAQRATLLRVSAGVAAGLLKNAWAAATTRLESKGIEPGVYRTVLLAPGSVPSRNATLAPSPTPTPMAALLASLPGARAAGKPAAGGGAADIDLHALGAEFEQALKRLDEALRHLAPAGGSATADGAAAQGKRLTAMRGALLASAGASNDRQMIDLVTRLFDSMLADSQLPAHFHAPIARLQVPAMRMAMRDRELLDSATHPLWQMIDQIGLAASGLPLAHDPRTAALLEHCNESADELARLSAPDTLACRRALDRLDAFVNAQLRTQQAEAAPAIENLQLAERRERLEQNLIQRLADQMGPMQLTPGIRRFMSGTWAKVLAEAMLRFGEQGDETRQYIKLVDELLWSLRLPDHPQSRQRLIALLPGILQRLRAGMALIALPQPEQQAILDELMAIHTEALRPGGRAAPAELTPEQIVQRMRDEVTSTHSVPQAFSDSVIDISSMETVPAELLPTEDAGADPAQRVDGLRVGERDRLFIQGRWQRVQLLWRSDQALFFLFAGETAGRRHSITRRALEKLVGANLLLPAQTRPIVQRAIDRLGRELALPS